MKRLHAACLMLFVLALPLHASADVVHIKNGDRISGAISQIEGERIRITPAYGSAFTIRLSEVVSIESDQAFQVELYDGSFGSYQFAGAAIDELLVLETPSEDAIPQEERYVHVSQLKAANYPREFFEWRTRLDMSQSYTSGNVDSKATNINGNLVMRVGEHRTFYNLNMVREKVEDAVVKDNDSLEFGYSWLLNGPWFIGANASYDQNEIALIQKRVTFNPAVGYDFWDRPGHSFNIQAGPGYQMEEIGGIAQEGPIWDWRLRISQNFLADSLEAYHNHRLFKSLGGRENLVFDSRTGLRYALTREIYVNVELQHDLDTAPAIGRASENTRLVFGAGISLN